MDQKPEISVVVLCYKSGNFLRTLYKNLEETLIVSGLKYEIVLVGNHRPGTDTITVEIIKELVASHPHTISVLQQKMKPEHAMGWDVRLGFNAAHAEIIAVMDGDGQVSPGDLLPLFYKLKKENLNIAKARRVTREYSLYRKFISQVFNILMRVLFPSIGNDVNGKPKLLTKEALSKLGLTSNDWFIDSEIMIKARRYGLKVGEVDTTFANDDECGSSVSWRTNVEFFVNAIVWRIKEFFV